MSAQPTLIKQPNAIERKPLIPWSLRRRWYAFKRLIPRLVRPGNPVWVRITFTELGLGSDSSRRDDLREVEKALGRLGLEFDRGAGGGGRDWEWDWSLHGPVQVTFVPHRRIKKRKAAAPKLTVVPTQQPKEAG